MSLIVGVHGIRNHFPGHAPEDVAAQKATLWAEHLAAGLGSPLDDGDVAFAYYAHHLWRDLPVAQGLYDGLDNLTPAETELAGHWLECLDLPEVTVQGRLTVPVRHAVEMLAKRFDLDGPRLRIFSRALLREVGAYIRVPDAPARHAAREEVASVIAAHRPRVVIAHSLGTVVTYEALHAHPELSVDLLITLGSPLALPHGVFHRLQPAPIADKGARPPGVAHWVNVADRGDPIAVLRPLSRYFAGVELDLPELIGVFAYHGVEKYLRTQAVADAVKPYLPLR
ncbi:hypothetical protein NHG22_16570 [Streptomyces sp. ATE26]|uniref:hypothetical protein n=1 Tax=unclassified Streptomyces TaxID=2593676 RepID=UPI00116EC1E6|nr:MULTISPECIES: hypothetical protein [unclassified Streptomyces]MDI1455415.1 hypothetical protein [Streptomyces sp. ATE26]GEK04598.1 hypothetical protein TNCT1_68740 [Streptomyces sp. 1-11]